MSRKALLPTMMPSLAEAAEVLQATPARIAVLASLSGDGPQTRGRLAERLGLKVGALNHHLAALREIGLIEALPLEDPDNYHRVEYRIDPPRLGAVMKTLNSAFGVEEDR